MVGAASGCWAMALNAAATDLPSLNAGNMHPSEVVSPAVMMETIAMIDMLSMLMVFHYLVTEFVFSDFLGTCTAAAM